MNRGRRMQYTFHGGDPPVRPTPVYPQGTYPQGRYSERTYPQRTFIPYPHDSRPHYGNYHPSSDWYGYNSATRPVYMEDRPRYIPTGARVYVEPMTQANHYQNSPYKSHDSVFYLNSLWNGGGAQSRFRPFNPESKQFFHKASGPIVDFPDAGVESRSMEALPREDEEIARVQDVDYEASLETVSTPSNQLEVEQNSDYVPLETIRRVKEEARQQAMRMRQSQNGRIIEMAELSESEASTHYDRPRSQRSTIPDGIVAGTHSNVYGRRLVSIPDPTHYATISDPPSEPDTERSMSRRPPAPPYRPDGTIDPRYDRPKKRTVRIDSSAKPILETERGKSHPELARCKRVICILLLATALLLLVTVGVATLLFLLSETEPFKSCRTDSDCITMSLIIAGSALTGCIVLCLMLTSCLWCCFVCYSHSVNRRRAYPIHDHYPHHRVVVQ